MEYCKEEIEELKRFQKAYSEKRAELEEWSKAHGALFAAQKSLSAKSVARDVVEGKTPDVSTKIDTSIIDKKNDLVSVVNLLQQAVAEQKRHVSEKLKQEYWKAYPEHPKTVAARNAFEEAIKLIRKGFNLDNEANVALKKDGLPAHIAWNACESNKFLSDRMRLLKIEREDEVTKAMAL